MAGRGDYLISLLNTRGDVIDTQRVTNPLMQEIRFREISQFGHGTCDRVLVTCLANGVSATFPIFPHIVTAAGLTPVITIKLT